MPRLSTISSVVGFVATLSMGATSFAITDPSQAPPPPPNQGGPVVMTQPTQAPPNGQVQVQQPPPQRLGLWAQARAGGGIDFFGGTHGSAMVQVGGGYITPQGFGITLYGSGRYMFSSPCSSPTSMTGCASNGGLLDIDIGIVARYTALPQARFHPVAEIGGQIHVMPGENYFGFGYGGQLSLGGEFDLTDSLSLDVLLRGQLFYAAFASRSLADWGALGLRIEPMVGLTYYF